MLHILICHHGPFQTTKRIHHPSPGRRSRYAHFYVGPAKIPLVKAYFDTPRRVVEAYGDWFSGYREDPHDYLQRTFEEISGYDEMIVLRNITYESHCEHHMAPIIGKVHVGYCQTAKSSASAN